MQRSRKSKQGFTLIELLVVIAIIAILSVVVILTLNPAELLRQTRDSNRISDLSVTKSAISFYLTSYASPVLASSTVATPTPCYVDAQITGPAGAAQVGTTTCWLAAQWFPSSAGGSAPAVVSSTPTLRRNVNGLGWMPINFALISPGGSPIANEPVDPLDNDGNHFYSYVASTTSLVFKMAAKMESLKYSNGGSGDVVSTDGGVDNFTYEVGTNLSL